VEASRATAIQKSIIGNRKVLQIMKLRKAFALCGAVLALSLVAGDAQPLVRISISNFAALSNVVVRLARAVAPNSKADFNAMLTGKLGMTNATTFDPKGPWEVAVWQEGGSNAPLIAIKGPIADVKRFQKELDPAGALSKQGKDWVQLAMGSAAIVFKTAEMQTQEEKSALKSWESEAISQPVRALELTLTPSESAKQRVLPLLAMARMSLPQMAAANSPNPKAMTGLFDLYFDGIEAFIKGLQKLKLAAGVDADSLLLEETVAAVPGTQLAQWIPKPTNPVRTEDLKGVNPEAFFSGAISLGKDAALIDLTRKFMQLSLEMQNQGTNEAMMNDLMGLVETCLPARISGSVFMNEQLGFTAVYRFPGMDAANVYGKMKPFIARWIKTQAGEGKMYSAATFEEKHHLVGNVPVDRFSFTMNLDSPLFQVPGQKEQIEAFMPNGKMELDYAVKDGQLFLASPDLMKGLLEGQAQSAPAMVSDDSTVALGYFNILSVLKRTSQANPAIPQALKERLSRIDLNGTAIRFQLRMDTQVHCDAHIPLKFFEQIGRFKDAS